VTHKDGTSCGFPEPTREYSGPEPSLPGKISRVA
jgi:hypothetical protein